VTGSILERRLILVAGKGGVGRSTVAAALAAATARRGRRTLLFQADANDRFGGYFGRPPVGPEIVPLADNLYAVNTNPAAALEEYGLMVLRFKRVYQLVFENRVTRHFLRAIPGLDDYSIIGKAWWHTTEEKKGAPLWDTLVFDLPASGHCLSMLRIAWVILETVPEGPLTRDARSLVELLLDRRRTALVLVTLAEDMPSHEARDLTAALNKRLGLKVAHLFVNQVYPDRFPPGGPEAAILDRLVDRAGQLPADLNALAAHSDLARRRRRLNEHYIRQLEKMVPARQSQLPLLFVPTLGPSEIDQLSRLVEGQVG
jgi:anion-transporting  ArsA/GET3 family ATPase